MKNVILFWLVTLVSIGCFDVRARDTSFSYEAAMEYYEKRKAGFSPIVAYGYFQNGAKAGDANSKVMVFALLYEFPNALSEYAEEAIHFFS